MLFLAAKDLLTFICDGEAAESSWQNSKYKGKLVNVAHMLPLHFWTQQAATLETFAPN